MQVMCDCGRTLNPEGRCDASHALTEEQYARMLERRQQKIKQGSNNGNLDSKNSTQEKRN